MIYLDANLFIYAYFKKRKNKVLTPKVKWMKKKAKEILKEINEEKEEYCISIIQLSEVVNLLKSVMSWQDLKEFIMGLYTNNSINITEVTKLVYLNAVDKITKYDMDPNDISAYLIMRELGITQIFTFDKHFQNLEGITRLPVFPDTFNEVVKN